MKKIKIITKLMQNELNLNHFCKILHSDIFQFCDEKFQKSCFLIFKNAPKVIEIVSKKLNFHQKTSKSIKNNSSSPTSTAPGCAVRPNRVGRVQEGGAFFGNLRFRHTSNVPSLPILLSDTPSEFTLFPFFLLKSLCCFRGGNSCCA